MHLLILGGSPDHLGGVEAFCDRSAEALLHRVDWKIDRILTGTAFLRLRRLPLLIRGLSALVRYRRLKPDCVWLQYVNLPDLSYLVLAKLLGLRVMVTPHLGSNWRSQSNPLLRTLSKWALSLADCLALISKTQELEIDLPPSVPRALIRNFLPAALLAAELPPQGSAPPMLQLIHSGRLSEGKGTFLFVEVCKRLQDAGVPFMGRITGGADAATLVRLRTLIAEFALDQQVFVLGRVPEEDLLQLLHKSDVLVHLSRIDSYPLIVLEAMAHAIIPVCMELAGARDMVETYDGCIVSKANAVQQAADYLSGLDIADIRRRGSSAAELVRRDYQWDRCAGALEAAVRACVTGDGKVVARSIASPSPV